ncbi:MAG: tRNA (guanosine(37)-N1)-methyltransferase TrmD [Tissierellia bacterium]|nr:tRNA (guanosine(37)-N1)-methyltransferase TrmD [Tissierellia bacterium]
MRFDIITIFPEFFYALNDYGVVGKAVESGKIKINPVNLRDYSQDKHKKVDDEIYGGGPGMLMSPQPICDAIDDLKSENSKTIFMSPQGKNMDNDMVIELSSFEHLIILCGHYEGVDQRIIDNYIDMEISIGDYILTGGEIPAMALIDSVSRFIPGVLGNSDSAVSDSLYNDLLKYSVYTRPADFRGMKVPEILLSGNHKLIEEWRMENSLENTKNKRPDLYEKYLKNKV